MPLTREMMRNAGSKAFFALKKYKFYESKTEGSLTTLSLFGDMYKFFFDSEKKIAWVVSKHHYQSSNTFPLLTRHSTWQGIFSFPRSIVYNEITNNLREEKIELQGKEDSKKLGVECCIVVNQVYKGNKDKLARIFGGILWKHYDQKVASSAMKAYGLSANSFDYSLIANNLEEFLDTLNKAPSILPVWRKVMAEKFAEIAAKRRHGDSKCAYASYDPLDYHNTGSFGFPNILKTVKDYLQEYKLTHAGWKYLLKLSPRSVLLLSNRLDMQGFVSLINWFAVIGVLPRYSLLKPFISFHILRDGRTESLTIAIRAAFKKAQKLRRGVRDFSSQIQLVTDWITREEVVFDHNQKKANWEWFMRQQEEWHENLHLREAEKLKQETKNETWESALKETLIDGYKVVPLTTTYDLIDEGKIMHHCVGTYTSSCLDGYSRVFSIRDVDDNNIATLQLIRSERPAIENYLDLTKWSVSQCRGVCNEKVSPEVEKVAEKVAKKYNNMYNKLPEMVAV